MALLRSAFPPDASWVKGHGVDRMLVMRKLGFAVVLVFLGCAPQSSAPASVQNTTAPSALPAPAAAPPAASPPEIPAAEGSPPASPPTGSSAPAASAPPPTAPPPEGPEPRATPQETQQCSARGGTIQPICRLGKLSCVVPYRDGGKPCSDKADCTGKCLYEGPTPAPANATGKCQLSNDPCGCKAPIRHGHVQAPVCLD